MSSEKKEIQSNEKHKKKLAQLVRMHEGGDVFGMIAAGADLTRQTATSVQQKVGARALGDSRKRTVLAKDQERLAFSLMQNKLMETVQVEDLGNGKQAVSFDPSVLEGMVSNIQERQAAQYGSREMDVKRGMRPSELEGSGRLLSKPLTGKQRRQKKREEQAPQDEASQT